MSLDTTWPEDEAGVRAHTLEQFRLIFGGNKAAIQEARAVLRKLSQSSGVPRAMCQKAHTREFVSSLVEEYQTLKDAAVRAHALNAFCEIAYEVAPEAVSTLLQLALGEICDETHGTVRKAAIRLAVRLRIWIEGSFDSNEMYPQSYREHLGQLRAMIEERMPKEWRSLDENESVVVPNLSPSVLKSLLLLWRQWSTREMLEESFCKAHPELSLPFPVQWFIEFEEANEEVTKEELGDEVWQGTRPSKETCVALQALEKRAYKHLASVLKQLGHSTKEIERAVQEMARLRDHSALDPIMRDLAISAARRGWHPHRFHTVMRAVEGYTGNRVARNVHGWPYSFLLASAYNNVGVTYRTRMSEFPGCLLAAHTAIDEYIDGRLNDMRKRSASLERKLKPHNSSGYFAKAIEQHEELRHVAHFALEWFAEVEPNDVIKKPSRQLAALILLAIQRLHWEAATSQISLFDRDTLKEFGGWKYPPSQSAQRVAWTLRGTLPTLEPFLVTPEPQEEMRESHTDDDAPPFPGVREVIGSNPNELDPKELELRLGLLFERFDMSAEEFVPKVKEKIYELSAHGVDLNASVQRYHEWFQALFPSSVQEDERLHMELYATAVDAWNVYPHAGLDGRSPLEMIRGL